MVRVDPRGNVIPRVLHWTNTVTFHITQRIGIATLVLVLAYRFCLCYHTLYTMIITTYADMHTVYSQYCGQKNLGALRNMGIILDPRH